MQSNEAINDLLLRLDPSETALLGWLKPQIDERHLREIALVDYGFNEEEYFQALQQIHQGQPIPVPLRWVPREALELMRWSEPDDLLHLSPPPTHYGTHAHLMRAFCCAVLLQAADESETQDYIDAENDTLIQLVASVLSLGWEASGSAIRFLCWRVSRMPDAYSAAPFFVMALLLLQASRYEPDQDATDLSLLCEWVTAEEARARTRPHSLVKTEEWLLGLTYQVQRHEVWRRLAHEVLLNPTQAFPEPAATTLRDIAKRLSSDTRIED